MSYLLMSGEQPKSYEAFMLECLEVLRTETVKGIALVALTEGEDSAITAYWNMKVQDRAYAGAHLSADVVDSIVMNNIDRYLAEAGSDREEDV